MKNVMARITVSNKVSFSCLKLVGGKVLYRESDIEKMLAENYRKAIL